MALENIRVYAPDSPPFSTRIEKGEGLLFNVHKLMSQNKIRVETAGQLLLNFYKLDKKRVDFLVTGYTITEYVIKNKKSQISKF